MKRISLACALVGCVVVAWLGIRWTSEGDHRSDSSTALSSEAPQAPLQREALPAAHPQVTREATEMSTPSAPIEETAVPVPVPDDLRIRVIDSTSRARMDLVAIRIHRILTSANFVATKEVFEGRATGPELEVRLARSVIEETEVGPPSEGQLQITALGAFVPKVSMSVPLQPWPTEPIDFVIPPHCVVRFRAQDEMGKYLSGRGNVTASIALPDRSRSVLGTVIDDGVSEALLCAPGVELSLSGRFQSGRRILPTVERVPNLPGAVHWIDLRLSDLPSVMVVRLVLESGEPLRNGKVQTNQTESRSVQGSFVMSPLSLRNHTDGDGYLRWELRDPTATEGFKRIIAFTHEHATQGLLAGYLDYSRAFTRGVHDLGEVVMQEQPLLAAGVVVDSSGRGVPKVSINAYLYDAAQMYPMVETLQATTDEAGRFLLRSIIPAERVELDFFAEGFVYSERLKVPRGTQDIVVALVSAASLTGSFRLPEGMDLSSIALGLEHHEDMGQPSRANRFFPQIDALGGFAAQNLWPGMATVHFRLSGGDPIFSVPDVQLVSGEVNQDPRLQDVQLCQGWRRLRVRLLDEKRSALDRAIVSISTEHKGWFRHVTSDREGLCTTWIEPQHRRFTIHVNRFRATTIEWSEEAQVLQLSPGLRVHVPIQVDSLPPNAAIDIRLRGVQASSSSTNLVDGVAEVIVSAPGRYRLIPSIRIYSESNVQVPLDLDPPIFVDIEDAAMQTLPTLHITKEMIQAVLDRK